MAGRHLATKQRTVDLKPVREIVSELKKVVWPTREQATNLSTIVIIVSIAVGVLLGTIDFIFYWIINSIILG